MGSEDSNGIGPKEFNAGSEVGVEEANYKKMESKVSSKDIPTSASSASSIMSLKPKKDLPLWSLSVLPPTPDLMYDVQKTEQQTDAMEIVFQQCVSAILYSLGISANALAIEKLSTLSSEYMHNLVTQLRSLVQVQRRVQPAIKDMKMLIRENGIKMYELHAEYTRSQDKLAKDQKFQHYTKKIASNAKEVVELKSSPEFEISETDPAAPLFYHQTFEILNILPARSKSRFSKIYPDLPPEYTYKKTSTYNEMVDDPRILKERLVEESRFGEKALQNVLEGYKDFKDISQFEDDEKTLVGDEKDELKEQDGVAKVVDGRKLVEDNSGSNMLLDQLPKVGENPETVLNLSKTAFDFVKFANRRAAYIAQKKEKLEKRIKEKKESPMARISYQLGAYTDEPLTKSSNDSLAVLIDTYLTDVYTETVKSVKTTAKKRKLRAEAEAAKRQRLLAEKEKERREKGTEQTFEFGGHDDALHEDEDMDDYNFDFDSGNEDEAQGLHGNDTGIAAQNNQSEDNQQLSNDVSHAELAGPESVEVTQNSTQKDASASNDATIQSITDSKSPEAARSDKESNDAKNNGTDNRSETEGSGVIPTAELNNDDDEDDGEELDDDAFEDI